MSTTFPRARRSALGYSIDQVEDFLEEARRAYDANRGDIAMMTSAGIRHVAFAMQKGGYSPRHVDAALERLEDAFALRERERVTQQRGELAIVDQARGVAQSILDRLSRPSGQRFARVSILSSGYNKKQVDLFCRHIVDYFQEAKPLRLEDVRSAVFRPQRGGYREAQVDLVLDSVVEVMLAVR